jgi:uncharacterized protein (DUF2147 family)
MRLACLAAAAAALIATPALAADPIEGDWMVGSGTRVRIAPCAARPERMCGLIAWLKNPNDKAGQPLRDSQNPDPKLRGRPIVGIAFIRDFRRAGPGHWTGGKIYDPNSGKTYDSKVRINGDGTLKVEGCVLVICQAQTWRRPA